MKLSPMMQQFMDIKNRHQDCILFFRLGDFYEMFFDDAVVASKELEITLTGRNYSNDERAPMCGVPYHSAESYIAKLIDRGYKVAICEQIEDPATSKGLVKRDVVQIITPGTLVSQSMLNEKENNYLVSVFVGSSNNSSDRGSGGKSAIDETLSCMTGIAYCDISTGELYVTQITSKDSEAGISTASNELAKVKAREILINENASELEYDGACFNVRSESFYDIKAAKEQILRQFKVHSLEGIGLFEKDGATLALGALLVYLYETQKQNLMHISNVRYYDISEHMSLDKATIKNLEITEALFEKTTQGTLIGILDKTNTAMGSRKMKQWLREPLNKVVHINERLNAVELLTDDVLMRNNLRENLKHIYDLERLCGRISCGNANGKDLIALKSSIFPLPMIKDQIRKCGSTLLENLEANISVFDELHDLIERAIRDDVQFTIKEGGVIKDGYSEELDALKFSIKDGQAWIAELEGKERERTGIKNLKVGFNRVFGYYIEITQTRSNVDLIPENYIRKQTLVNAERYITPELKEWENLLLNAETKINQMEYELFVEIRTFIHGYIAEIQRTAVALASLDVLCSFAEAGAKLGYTKPNIHDGNEIVIRAGRHPVIERTIKHGVFVSNDVYMNDKDTSMLLITGPNMAGKSTYMRQTALIVLMAQSGCFVPCENASIGVVDRIFTRIGASDNLSQGQSTFYVEMSELAYILNSATDKSLIILDEIGRGTSTYDGLSIAWAVVEHLCTQENRTRTLFATHYHELTSLEGHIDGFKNLNVDVTEEGGNVVFLHKIVPGSASRSYGIHVASLAGVPPAVLDRASLKLAELEQASETMDLTKYDSPDTVKEEQVSFFTIAPPSSAKVKPNSLGVSQAAADAASTAVVERLKKLDIMNITPLEAFRILAELKEEC